MVKNILMIVAPENYRDEELEEPKKAFIARGYEITIASKGATTAKGMLGGSTTVDTDISQVKVEDYDVIVFVGGSGANVYFHDETAHNLAKNALSAGQILGAICIAPSTLANAGLLEGKNATAFSSEEQNLKEKGANFTGEEVTVDGKIVTASGPSAAEEFGNKIISLLEENK